MSIFHDLSKLSLLHRYGDKVVDSPLVNRRKSRQQIIQEADELYLKLRTIIKKANRTGGISPKAGTKKDIFDFSEKDSGNTDNAGAGPALCTQTENTQVS